MKTKLSIVFSFALAVNQYADSATWNLNPTSTDWNTAANWTPNVVPNGPQDVATFDVSNETNVIILGQRDTVNNITFTANASPYTITVGPDFHSKLVISGQGIINDSAVTQNFVTATGTLESQLGEIVFENRATAGDGTVFTNNPGIFGHSGGVTSFFNHSSAGTATFVSHADPGFGMIQFNDHSTAANANFTNDGGPPFSIGGLVQFFGNSNAGNATFVNGGGMLEFASGGSVNFAFSASAGTANFTLLRGGSHSGGGSVGFGASSTADHSIFTVEGSDGVDAQGGAVSFVDNASAGDAVITLQSGLNTEAPGASVLFNVSSSAGNCTIVAINGSERETGATINFLSDSLGGTARLELLGPGFGSGTLIIDGHNPPGISVGSIEGGGRIILGQNNLTVGTNNLTTTFSGAIADGENGSGGSLTKVGNGTLTLSGASTYTGGTIVNAGVLQVANDTGSGTGTGAVNVDVGVLGGSGIIVGATTVGTGSGTGAFLAPAAGTNVQATLTIQGALTFNTDATYTCTFRAKRNRAKTDMVIGNGLIINSGAMIALSGQTTGVLTQGLVMTLISNTSGNPISGTFSNLPDGAIVTFGGNNFQANYEGGDGNDLTLTVVP